MNLDATANDSAQVLEIAARLRSLARRLVRDAHVAEDIVQDALSEGLRSGPAEPDQRMRWLGGVVRLQVKNLARRNQNRAHRESSAPADRPTPSPDEIAEKLEAIELVSRALRELDEPFRSTIARLYIEEVSPADIARQDSVAEGTVRWRHSVGLSRLRADLDRRFGGARGAWCAVLVRLDNSARATLATNLLAISALFLWSLALGLVVLLIMGQPDAEKQMALVAAAHPPAVVATGPDRVPQSTELVDQLGDAKSGEPRRSLPAESADERTPHSSRAGLSLRVVGRGGDPLADVHVVATAGEQVFERDTSRDGLARFTFDQVDGEPSYAEFVVTGVGTLPVRFTEELICGAQRDLGDVQLDRTGVIEGVVRGPDGHPFAGAHVIASLPNHPNIDRALGPLGYASGAIAVDTSDDEGQFRLEQVRSGSVAVYAQADDTLCSQVLVSLAPSALVLDVEITLEQLPADNTISGRVVNELQQPVAGASVTYAESGQLVDDPIGASAMEPSGYRPVNTTTSDFSGHFSVRVRKDRTYDFYAAAENRPIGTRAAYGVAPGTGDVCLKFVSGVITAYVEFPGGAQGRQYSVQVWNVLRSHSFFEGKFTSSIAEIPTPGEPFVLLFSSSRYSDVLCGPFEPDAGSPSARAVFVNAPQIRGRIHEDGRAIAGAFVRLHLPRPFSDGYEIRYEQAMSGADGMYALPVPSLLEGQRKPLAILGPGGAAARLIDLKDLGSGIDGVDFELLPFGSLEVVVHSEGGAPVSGRIVALWPTGSRWYGNHVENQWTPTNFVRPHEELTDATGMASFPELLPMRYSLMLDRIDATYLMEAGDPPDRSRVYECEVTPGHASRVEISLDDTLPVRIDISLVANGAPAEGWIGQLLRRSQCDDSRQPWGAASDPKGVMQLEAPYRGEWTLRVAPAAAERSSGWIDVPVSIDGSERIHTVRLETGTVQGTYGSVPGVSVTFASETPGGVRCNRTVLTGPGGRFFAAHVLSGRARVTASQSTSSRGGDGEVPAPVAVDVPLGSFPIEVHLP